MTDKALQKKTEQAVQKATPAKSARVVAPAVDIRETEAAFFIEADMPGVDEKNVSIDLDRNVLTISGEYVPKALEGYNLVYREYEVASYERTFTLGNSVDRDGIAASVKDGVLTLSLPKAKEAQPRRIEVQAG